MKLPYIYPRDVLRTFFKNLYSLICLNFSLLLFKFFVPLAEITILKEFCLQFIRSVCIYLAQKLALELIMD